MGQKFDSFADLKKALLDAAAKPQPATPSPDIPPLAAGERRDADPASTPSASGSKPQEARERPERPALRPNSNSRPAVSRPNPSPTLDLSSVYRPGSVKQRSGASVPMADGTTASSRTVRRIAEAGALRIASTDSVPRSLMKAAGPDREPAGTDSDVVTIGLDFGTAFTKVAVSWLGERGIVDWGLDLQGKPIFWIPSTFCRTGSGVHLGNLADGDDGNVNAIKLRLIAAGLPEAEERLVIDDAVTYLSLVLRHVIEWSRRWVTARNGSVSGCVLHVGLPAESGQKGTLVERYMKVAATAWGAATKSGGLTEAWRTPQIHVIPEFAAQLYGYLKDPHRARDSHLLIDIGAGTVDFVAFIPHIEKGRNRTPILSARVKSLGAHKLLAARVGAQGQGSLWSEDDALLTDAELAARSRQPSADVGKATADFADTIAVNISALISGAKDVNSLCDNLQRDGVLPTFVSGGGGDAPFFRNSIAKADARIRTRPLPVPEGLQWSGDPGAFHRVSVAYGLSFSRRSIGEVLNTADLESFDPPPTREVGDRDESR